MPDIFVSTSSHSPRSFPASPKPKVTEPHIPRRHHSRFSAFLHYPEKINFETKEKDEKVVLLLRQHPIVNLGWILMAIIMLLIPTGVGMLGIFSSFPSKFKLIIDLTWYLITFAFIMESFLDWFFNVYIVTNLRIVDIDFVNLIYKNVSDANIDKIQDVSYNMGGVARTIFNYGDVVIQTAAEISEFDFAAVPNPAKVAKIIEDLMINK